MKSFRPALLALALILPFLLPASAAAQDSATLASKSIAQLYAVQNRLFAIADGGASYSRLDLFQASPLVITREWLWDGGIEGGAVWGSSLLLRANYWPTSNDSIRVTRLAALRYDGAPRTGDSLVFRDPLGDSSAGLADGARLTALAIRARPDTSVTVLGFGRLGIAYARLAPEVGSPNLLYDTAVNFLAFPSASSTAIPLYSCRWNRVCRVDTLSSAPPLDSVLAVAIDSSASDSAWILVATQKGLRRGRWGGTNFPYVALPDTNPGAVSAVFTSPSRALAWAFTESRYFYSDDHGASWRVVPASVPGVSYDPAGGIYGFSPRRPPSAAFRGDTTFINFNLGTNVGIGIVAFRRDTVLPSPVIRSGIGEVLIDTADGLGISGAEGELTMLAVAANGSQVVLATGTTIKGVFFRRLDQPPGAFTNLNRLKPLKGGLAEIITYPTLLTSSDKCGDAHVRIGYRLPGDANVTITVYNYGMEKVRTIVRNARRLGGGARSEDLSQDRWDGCDDGGRFVSVGTYYILVESSAGDKGFGKAIVTRGRQ